MGCGHNGDGDWGKRCVLNIARMCIKMPECRRECYIELTLNYRSGACCPCGASCQTCIGICRYGFELDLEYT